MSHAPSPPSALPDIAQIEEDLEFFDDWEDRYRFLIDLGKSLPEMPEEDKTPANIVHGCSSQVWLTAAVDKTGVAHSDSPRLILSMASDALIVRGLLGLVAAAYANRSADEVVAYDINGLFERLALLQHLSMTRGNGLRAMVVRIQQLAAELTET